MNDVDGPFFVDKISSMFGADMYGIFDLHFVPAEPILETRRSRATGRKNTQRYWKGTKDEADWYCAQLNKEARRGGARALTLLDNLSKSQRIHYANDAQRRRRNGRVATGTQGSGSSGGGAGGVAGRSLPGGTGFVRCERCDRMVRVGHECAGSDG